MADTDDRPNAQRDAAQRTGFRSNIYHLSDANLSDLRLAFRRLYDLSASTNGDGEVDHAGNAADERGYQWIAGVHGAPVPIYCQHGTPHFLTWHRAYLWWFEKLLQDQVPGVYLPWWDWSTEQAVQEGLPAAVTDETWTNPDTGQVEANPLLSAFSQQTGALTERAPGMPTELAPLAASVEFALAQPTHLELSQVLENPHNFIHGWVGGDMGSVPTAAYDPVFWLHHANVDRLWFFWQQAHSSADVGDDIRNFVCAPFTLTGNDVLDIAGLGYDYVDQESMVSMPPTQEDGAAPTETRDAVNEAAEQSEAEPTPALDFELDVPTGSFRRATLEVGGAVPPVESVTAHLFLNNPGATLETPRTGAEGYAGMWSLLGHGHCLGGPGHCDLPHRHPNDPRPRHHLTPADASIDITFPLAAALASDDTPESVTVTMVAANADAEPGDMSAVEFASLSIITRA